MPDQAPIGRGDPGGGGKQPSSNPFEDFMRGTGQSIQDQESDEHLDGGEVEGETETDPENAGEPADGSILNELGYEDPEQLIKDFKDLRKGNDHAKKKISQQGNRISELEKMVREIAGKQGAEKPPEGQTPDYMEELLRDGKKTVIRTVDGYLSERQQRESQFNTFRSEIVQESTDAMIEGGFDVSKEPPDVQAKFDELYESPVVQMFFNAINPDNFLQYKDADTRDNIVEAYKFMGELLVNAARGANAKNIVRDETVKAKRDAKQNYLLKKKANSTAPQAKPKTPRSPSGQKKDDFAAMIQGVV